MPYQGLKLRISPEKQRRAIKGGSIRLSSDDIGNGQLVFLHPANYKKLSNCKGGCLLHLAPGEIIKTASHHGLVPNINTTGLNGSGIFDSIWSGIKSAGKWLRDSGVGSAVLDVAKTVAEPIVGKDIADTVRGGIKSLTGVGLKKGRKPKGAGLYL